MGVLQVFIATDSQQRVCIAVPLVIDWLVAADDCGSRLLNRLQSRPEVLLHAAAEHRPHRSRIKLCRHARDELLTRWTFGNNHQSGVRAELPGSHQTAANEIIDHSLSTLFQSTRQNEHRIDARELAVELFAPLVRRFLQRESRVPSPGVTAGPDQRMRYELVAVGVRGTVDQLDKPGGHPCRLSGLKTELGEQQSGAGVRRVSLGNDRVTRSDRRGKVTACNTVVGIREVVRSKNHDRTDGAQHGSNVRLGIDGRVRPRTIPGTGSRLTQLVDRAGQFSRLQSRLNGQASLTVGDRHNVGRAGLDPTGIVFQEGGKLLSRPASHSCCSSGGVLNDLFNLGPGADRKLLGQGLFVRGIDGLKGFFSGGSPPLTIHEDRLH